MEFTEQLVEIRKKWDLSPVYRFNTELPYYVYRIGAKLINELQNSIINYNINLILICLGYIHPNHTNG